MTAALIMAAALFSLGGFLVLGVWIGLGLAEDRAAQAANDELWRRALERAEVAPAARVVLLEPVARPRLPGYAEHFPRPGRYDPGAAPMFAGYARHLAEASALISVPHAGSPRPAPSPVDLDADVRRMCDDTELYVAGLIARSRHAERTHPW